VLSCGLRREISLFSLSVACPGGGGGCWRSGELGGEGREAAKGREVGSTESIARKARGGPVDVWQRGSEVWSQGEGGVGERRGRKR